MRKLLTAAALLGGFLLPATAQGHDHWINKQRLVDPVSNEWCCNEHDCDLVPSDAVSEQKDGVLLRDTEEVIPYARVIWKSADGRWWRCRYLSNPGKTRCLIGPPPNT